MKVSYAITVSSEIEEFTRLLNYLISHKGDDEIVVLVDGTKKAVYQILDIAQKQGVRIVLDKFEGNFAEWKNKLNKNCTGDWIFQLDADEMPSDMLIQNLHTVLESTEAEIIAVPRKNIVEGITEEDIRRWGWCNTDKGINWPDYQWRIYRNVSHIRWAGKVHEKPVGALKYSIIPSDQTLYRLDHYKGIEKQREQNNYYSTLVGR